MGWESVRSDIDTITTQSATAVAFAESHYDAAMRTDKWGPRSGHDKSTSVRQRANEARDAYEPTHLRPEHELSLLNIVFLLNRSISL